MSYLKGTGNGSTLYQCQIPALKPYLHHMTNPTYLQRQPKVGKIIGKLLGNHLSMRPISNYLFDIASKIQRLFFLIFVTFSSYLHRKCVSWTKMGMKHVKLVDIVSKYELVLQSANIFDKLCLYLYSSDAVR